MTDSELIYPNPFGHGQPSAEGQWFGRIFTSGPTISDVVPESEDEIEEIIAQWQSDDYWDGDCAALVLLKDGRFMAWESWWGPTGDGFTLDAYGGDSNVYFSATREEAIRFGLTDEGRRWLDLPFEEPTNA